DDLKRRFLASMSEDLRTPLESVVGYSRVLAEQLIGHLPEEHHRVIRNLNQSSEQLLALLDNAFYFSQIEAGQLAPAPVPVRVGELVSQACRIAQGAAHQRKTDLLVAVPTDL